LLEESGYRLTAFGEQLFRVLEEKPDKFAAGTRFRMWSDYYECHVSDTSCGLKLDAYEAELGFMPVWLEPQAALRANLHIMQSRPDSAPPWIARDTWLLEQLQTVAS
jgi:hypothetical protein